MSNDSYMLTKQYPWAVLESFGFKQVSAERERYTNDTQQSK